MCKCVPYLNSIYVIWGRENARCYDTIILGVQFFMVVCVIAIVDLYFYPGVFDISEL